MKRLCFVALLLFSAVCLRAQSPADCENVVKSAVDAINAYSSETLRQYLASDFECSGQTGHIADLVLDAIIEKLEQSNDRVIEFKKTSESRDENTLTLVYSFVYSNRGEKTTTFVFNGENKITSLELLKAKVKKSLEKVDFEKPQDKVITIPISLSEDNLIVAQATINGEKHNFIIDSGCSALYLNSKYFGNGTRVSTTNKDVNGAISTSQSYVQVDSFDFNGIRADGMKVITSNLSHLENGTEVYGLIGYAVYKDYDLLFDYKKKTLTLIDPDYTETFLKDHKYKYEEVPLVMSKSMKYIPLIKGQIDTTSLTLGIDCGATSDLLDSGLWDEFKNNLRRVDTAELQGLSNEKADAHMGKLKSLKIGGKTFRNTWTVFNDISHLNMDKDERIDGLVGYEILSRQKTILSYRNGKLIFIK